MLEFISGILRTRGAGTVRVSKVKGHATEDKVACGRVRRAVLEFHSRADEAADLGRRRQTDDHCQADMLAGLSYLVPSDYASASLFHCGS